MENAINTVVTEKALADVERLAKLVLEADKAFIKASESGYAFSKSMSTPPKTSDALNKQLQETQRILKELQNDYKKQETALANLQKKYEGLSVAKKQGNATDRQTIIDNREIRKELDGQAIANSNLTSYIQKLSVERAKASRIVADYNAQVALGTALTEEQSAELSQATASFQKYDNAIKAGKKSIGDAREYVGQYERANLGLVNSVNQIVREVPSATFGIQTFFLAISNNVPIMVDEVKKAVQANKDLAKSGEAITPVWKQVSSAIFSFNTILNVSLLVLALYGKEIGKAVSEMLNFSTALDEANKRQEEFNKTKLEGRKDAQTDIIELRKYLAVVKDEKLSMELRDIALKKLREQYPFYFKNLTDAQILLGKTSAAEKQLTIDLEKRKEVEKKTALNVENKQRLIDLEKEQEANNKLLSQAQKTKNLTDQRIEKVTESRTILRGERQEQLKAEDAYESALRKRAKTQQEIDKISKDSIANDQAIFTLKKETIALEYTETKATEENTRAIKLNTKAREDYLASEYELWRLRTQNQSDRNKEIMDDEASGYELRLMASEQYYANELDLANRAAEEELRILAFTTDERKRVAENEFTNSKEQLDAWLKDSKISREQYNKGLKDAEEQLQYDRDGIIKDATNQQNIIYENQAQRLIELNRELVGEMERAWNEINFGKADVLIDERSLKGFEDLGKLLKGIGEDMPIEEIRTRLAEINAMQEANNMQIRRAEMQVELDRAEAEKARIERAIETDGKLNNLTDAQIESQKNSNKTLIDLDKEIIKSKEDIVKADNEATEIQIQNALRLKEEKLRLQMELKDELINFSNQIFENTINYYDREIERSNEYYDALLENAENGSEQEQMLQEERAKKEEQLQRRKIDLQRKQAIFNKLIQVAEIVASTASAIAKIQLEAAILRANPFTAALATVALSQIPIVLGTSAVQVATVMATPLPQYKDGRGKGKDEFAVVGDGGRSEVIQRGNGRIEVTPSVPTITHLGKDDIVHKSLDDFERSRLAIQNASIMASFGSQSRQLQMFDYYLGRELHGISNKIEKGIERGFKKAKIYNNVRVPKIDIGHLHYKNSGLT